MRLTARILSAAWAGWWALLMRGALGMIIPTVATLGLPPLVAGVLFHVSARRRGRAA